MNDAQQQPAELTFNEHATLLRARALRNDYEHALATWQQARLEGNHTTEYTNALATTWRTAAKSYDQYISVNRSVLRTIIMDKHHKIVEGTN